MRTCVFCGSSSLGRELQVLAHDLGRALAEAGDELVYGGTMTGLMGDLARGAREAGGRVVGIVPSVVAALGSVDDRADELVAVDTLGQRKVAMVEGTDRFVVLPGGLGTMDELLEVLTMRQLGAVRAGVDVVVLDPDGYWDGLFAQFEVLRAAGATRPAALAVRRVRTVAEVVTPSRPRQV